jgi:hypothetical protein
MFIIVLAANGADRHFQLPQGGEIRRRDRWDIVKIPVQGCRITLPIGLSHHIFKPDPWIEVWESGWLSRDGTSFEKVQIVSDVEGNKLVPFAAPSRDKVRSDGKVIEVAGFTYPQLALTTLDKSGILKIASYSLSRNGELVDVHETLVFHGRLNKFNLEGSRRWSDVVRAAQDKLASGDICSAFFALPNTTNRRGASGRRYTGWRQ